MKKGSKIFKIIGKADIGQSLIVQNELILGVECIEGTDELLIKPPSVCNCVQQAQSYIFVPL